MAAFTSLVVAWGLSSYVSLRGLDDIQAGLVRSQESSAGVRLALELASAVRDQYAHQAHTIIIGDASHLHYYGMAKQRVVELSEALRTHVDRADESAWIDQIEQASGQLDRVFRDDIVPAVLRGERASVQARHDEAQRIVSSIQERVDRLVARFESKIDAFQAEVDVLQRDATRWTLVMLILAPLSVVLVGLYITRSVARPVARLHAGAARLASGDLETHIELDSPDELGALAQQFNAMTAAIREQQGRLVQSEKLAGIGRLAAGVAHEINNPLGVILGYTRLMQRRAEGQAAQDLRVVEEETLRCKEIVDGLLDLSRPHEPVVEPVDLAEVCREVVARVAATAEPPGVSVVVEGAGVVHGHGRKLRQVLHNLVRNAAEAAGAGGHVEVRIAQDAAGNCVDVHDDGAGLAPEVRDRLFEPFCTSKPKGTGLGLAVSRAIARAHGGDVSASGSPLGGACFTLRLPRHPDRIPS